MKNGWSSKRLDEVCWIKPPKSEARAKISANKLVSFLPMEDMGIDQEYVRPTQTKPLSSVIGSYTYFADGDVLLAKITPCFENGKLGIAQGLTNGIGFGSSEYIVFRPDKTLSKEWLYYYLSRETFRVEGAERMSGAVGHKRVSMEFIESYPIPVPPLPEQQRIAGILGEVFEGIATAKANAEKHLQNARALFDAVLCRSVIGETTKEWRDAWRGGRTTADSDLKSLFGQIATTDRKLARSEETIGHEAIRDLLPEEWRLASIEQLFNLIDYRGKTATKSGSGRRLITARNIRMGFLSEEPVTFISEEQYKKWMVRGFPKPGDIFFVTEGHTMGFVALNTRTDEFALAQRTITLQPSVPFSTRFFFYFMLSSHFQKLVKLNATGAAAVGMKASKFRSLPLAFPSFAEQEIIADKLDALREETQCLESIYQQKLAALDELKKSLLYQAFSGKL
ncbi:MAG: restriction endonuclease subunit S [Nitrospirae bacterium]|nr:restriction endonuclease subunit S [Nitrospirota bacterium]